MKLWGPDCALYFLSLAYCITNPKRAFKSFCVSFHSELVKCLTHEVGAWRVC